MVKSPTRWNLFNDVATVKAVEMAQPSTLAELGKHCNAFIDWLDRVNGESRSVLKLTSKSVENQSRLIDLLDTC